MKGLRIISWVVIAIMALCGLRILIADSLGHGAGFDVFLAGTPSAWQTFINQDLVSGLFIALAWMIHRERGGRPVDTFAWGWLVMWWGNIVVAVYVLAALRQSGGDARRMFAGRRAGTLAPVWPVPALPLRGLLILAAAAILVYMGLLVQRAADAISVAGALLGLLPLALGLVLLAFPAKPATGAMVR